METNTFVIVDPVNQKETPLELQFLRVGGNIRLVLGGKAVVIDRQQLMELGTLFIATAGMKVDFDSACELANGFGLSLKPILKLKSTCFGGER